MIAFAELADRVWVARSEWFDVNLGLVAGDEGLLLIDTNASGSLGRQTLEAVRRVSGLPLIAAVNTHVHADHTLGNAVVAGTGAALIAHENAAAALPEHVRRFRLDHAARYGSDPDWPDLLDTEIRIPERTLSSALGIDLGDRFVEILHPGRGHTDGDLVVRVAAADVLFAGDLVEESGFPDLGADSFPIEWPATLDLVQTLTNPATRIVPGHGAVVDRDFVDEQRAALGVVAETIRDLVGRGVPEADAAAAADWPYPVEVLAAAISRGYQQQPAVRRRLPLI